MHTANHSVEEIIGSVLPFSRYAQRLLESEPELRTELLQNLQRPFLREEMQACLNADCGAATDETARHGSFLFRAAVGVALLAATRY